MENRFSFSFNQIVCILFFIISSCRHWDTNRSLCASLVSQLFQNQAIQPLPIQILFFASIMSSASSTSCRSSVRHLSTDDRIHKTLLNYKLLFMYNIFFSLSVLSFVSLVVIYLRNFHWKKSAKKGKRTSKTMSCLSSRLFLNSFVCHPDSL